MALPVSMENVQLPRPNMSGKTLPSFGVGQKRSSFIHVSCQTLHAQIIRNLNNLLLATGSYMSSEFNTESPRGHKKPLYECELLYF